MRTTGNGEGRGDSLSWVLKWHPLTTNGEHPQSSIWWNLGINFEEGEGGIGLLWGQRGLWLWRESHPKGGWTTWPGAAPLSPPYLPAASVTLDAASAHADLIISQDLKTVTLDQVSQSGWTEPTDPERFHPFRCVLGLARLLLRLPGLGGGAPRARGRGLRGGRGLRASTTEGHAGVGARNRLLDTTHRRLRVPGAHQGRHPGGSLGLSQESGRPRESRMRGGSLLRRHYQQPHLHLPGLLSRAGLPLLPALVSRHRSPWVPRVVPLPFSPSPPRSFLSLGYAAAGR